MKDDNGIKTKRLRLNIENFYLRVNCPVSQYLQYSQHPQWFALLQFELQSLHKRLSTNLFCSAKSNRRYLENHLTSTQLGYCLYLAIV